MARQRRTRSTDALSQKTVVFDFGGVISAAHDPVPAIHAETGGDIEEVRAAFWGERLAYDTGDLTLEEYWGRVCAAAGVEDPSADELAHLQDVDNRYWLEIHPESRSLIHDLARNGVRLVLLSNASVAFGEAVRRAEWFEAFSFAIISGEEGVVKPDVRIFEVLLETLAHETGGVERPGSTIFFDDVEENVEAARRLGIDAHRWPRNGDGAADNGWEIARAHLAGRGIPLD